MSSGTRGVAWSRRGSPSSAPRWKTLVILDSNTTSPDPNMGGPYNKKVQATLPQEITKDTLRMIHAAYSYSTEHLTEGYVNELYELYELPKTQEAARRMAEGLSDNVWMPS